MPTPKFADRFQFASTGTSAAALTLGAASTGCRTLAQCIADGDLAVGDTVSLYIVDAANNWEDSLHTIGGTTSAPTLSRTSVTRSSAGGTTAATFNGSALTVFNDPSAALLTALAALPAIVVSSSAPSNSDNRPDGTIYFQTA